MKLIGGAVIAFLVIGITYFLFFGQTTEAPEPASGESMMKESNSDNSMGAEEEVSDEAMMAQTITLSEIAEHDTAEDCWMAIEGTVYDVTEYIDGGKHPGGVALLEGCGIDATELFNDRPNGSGPHSEKARSFLPNYEIGQLE